MIKAEKDYRRFSYDIDIKPRINWHGTDYSRWLRRDIFPLLDEKSIAYEILIDLDKPHFYPRHNLLSSLVYSAQASDVETVIVDGKIIMDNYQLKTVDLEKVYEEVSLRGEGLYPD